MKDVAYRTNPIMIVDLLQIIYNKYETIPLKSLENVNAKCVLRLKNVVKSDYDNYEDHHHLISISSAMIDRLDAHCYLLMKFCTTK